MRTGLLCLVRTGFDCFLKKTTNPGVLSCLGIIVGYVVCSVVGGDCIAWCAGYWGRWCWRGELSVACGAQVDFGVNGVRVAIGAGG